MKVAFPMLTRAMVLLSSVWAVYGIGVGNAERDFMTSHDTSAAGISYNASPVVADLPASPNTTPEQSNSTSNFGDLSTHYPTDKITYAPAAPVPQPPPASNDLSTSAKAGIITASVVVFLLVFILLIEYTYLRHKRHEHALQRAVEEVERGTELKDSNISESKENMVLESRVEIVVEEGEASERSSIDGGDEWDAGTDGECDEGDGDLSDWGRGRTWERGRNGMSLPRRDTSV